jgi:hypothetical protein
MTQMPSKHEALSLNPVLQKRKRKKKIGSSLHQLSVPVCVFLCLLVSLHLPPLPLLFLLSPSPNVPNFISFYRLDDHMGFPDLHPPPVALPLCPQVPGRTLGFPGKQAQPWAAPSCMDQS